MRTAIYIRISTDRPDETSTTTQEARCREYAIAKGWEVHSIYMDRGKSAFNGGRRPEHDRLMADIEAGVINAVVVWKLDRWSRSASEWYQLWDRLTAERCAWASVTDQFDTSTRMGKAMVGVVALFAELESGIKSERITEWHRHRSAAGTAPAALAGFGFRRTGGKLHPVKKEAALVAAAAESLLGGASIRSIVREWNRRGIKTRHGNTWEATAFRKTLTSPTMIGCRMLDGVLVEGEWEPILDRDAWQAVRALFADPTRRVTTDNHRKLLSGIVHCSRCGHKMQMQTSVKGPRYSCRVPYATTGPCGRVSILASIADNYMKEAMIAVVGDGLPALAIHDPAEVGRLEEELSALASDYGAGAISRAEWQAARVGIEARLNEAIDRARTSRIAVPANLADVWDKLTVEERRSIILAVVETVTIEPGYGKNDRIKITWRV